MDSDPLTDVSLHFRKLAHATQHLRAMKDHFTREDDIIFHQFEIHGLGDFVNNSSNEHKRILCAIKSLVQMILHFKHIDPRAFRKAFTDVVTRLTSLLQNNLLEEESVLYPMALKVIPYQEWPKMKQLCDELGYCGIHI